ncbi:MAG: hypothetical protein NZ609_12305 [Acidimicrobiales bacterium]|nr:hypothetical protein [Acidimicrobiales bacterium]
MARSAGSSGLQPLTAAVATGNSNRERPAAENLLAGAHAGRARGVIPIVQTPCTGTV